MSDSNAKQSKRSKVDNPISGSLKHATKRNKQVFKYILENPFTQSKLWPYVDNDFASHLMDSLCIYLAGLGNYNRIMKDEKFRKKGDEKMKIEVPKVQNYVTIGFNPTVKALEAQSKHLTINKKNFKQSIEGSENSKGYLKYVFVAKYDIGQPLLTNPFPMLTYTASRSKSDRVKLIQLPRGAMEKFSKVLNIDNVGIIGIRDDAIDARKIFEDIEAKVQDVDIPWLEFLFDDSRGPSHAELRGPIIKSISTTAPVGPSRNKKSKVQKDLSVKKV